MFFFLGGCDSQMFESCMLCCIFSIIVFSFYTSLCLLFYTVHGYALHKEESIFFSMYLWCACSYVCVCVYIIRVCVSACVYACVCPCVCLYSKTKERKRDMPPHFLPDPCRGV